MKSYNLERRSMAITPENIKKKSMGTFIDLDGSKEKVADIYGNGYLQIFTKGDHTFLQINRSEGTINVEIGSESLFDKIMAAETEETTEYKSPWRKYTIYKNGTHFIDMLMTEKVTWLEIDTEYI